MRPGIDVVKEIAREVKARDLKFMATFHHGFHMYFYPKRENSQLRPVSKYLWMGVGDRFPAWEFMGL